VAILSLRNFSQTVQDFAAAAQGATATALDFTVGAVLRALTEANASAVLWLQYVALQVLAVTRLATSSGTDVDSFVGDYGLTRLAAVAATGAVTFTRAYATQPAVILPGSMVKSTDLSQVFSVTIDTTNAAWNVASQAYVMAAGVSTLTVPVQAEVAGSAGNVQPGTLTVLASGLPVDSVTNALAFTNGVDPESDAALKASFPAYLASLARGTAAAIEFAASQVQAGLFLAVVENTPAMGIFTLVVDDGTGSPPASLLAAVRVAIDPYRPVGSVAFVTGPTLVGVSVELTIMVIAGVSKTALIGPVSSAITAFVDALGVGAALPFTQVASVAYGVSPSIVNVTGVTVNGATLDLPAAPTTVYRTTSVVVS
jgi:phage-related baseplate assembly protein